MKIRERVNVNHTNVVSGRVKVKVMVRLWLGYVHGVLQFRHLSRE